MMKIWFSLFTFLFPPLLARGGGGGAGSPALVGATNHLRIRLPDPKTIAHKESYSDLKFLCFGTSRTWGTGLEDPGRDAFPFLLSANATNLGIRAGTTIYPSRCAESMLRSDADDKDHDGAFDVIVIECTPNFYLATIRLAQRVRQRFPRAIIVFLDMWLGTLYRHKPSGKDVAGWAAQEGLAPMLIHPELPRAIVERTGVDDWEYDPVYLYTPSQLEELESLGVVVSAPLPANIHEAMQKYSHYFVADLNHYSKEGHEYVAMLILDKLKQVNFRHHHDAATEPWGEHDFCESWFLTGKTSLKTTMHLRPFTEGKYSLEAVTGGKNWIAFAQGDDKPLKVFAQFMVRNPCGKYPEAKLSVDGQSVTVKACMDVPYSHPVHVTQEVYVGLVGRAGEHLLIVEPGSHVIAGPAATTQVADDDDDEEKWPFRLTGLLLIPEDSPF